MVSTLDLNILYRRAHYQALQSQKILAVPTESDCLSLLLTLQERLPRLPRLPLIVFRQELFITYQLHSGTSNTGTDALYWVNLGSLTVPANGSLTIYLCFYATTQNVLNTTNTGVAP